MFLRVVEYCLHEWVNRRTAFSNLTTSYQHFFIMMINFLNFAKEDSFVSIIKTNNKISCLTLWMRRTWHRCNIIIVIIMRWKTQLEEIPTTARKFELSAKLITNCNTFSLPMIACSFIVSSTVVITGSSLEFF